MCEEVSPRRAASRAAASSASSTGCEAWWKTARWKGKLPVCSSCRGQRQAWAGEGRREWWPRACASCCAALGSRAIRLSAASSPAAPSDHAIWGELAQPTRTPRPPPRPPRPTAAAAAASSSRRRGAGAPWRAGPPLTSAVQLLLLLLLSLLCASESRAATYWNRCYYSATVPIPIVRLGEQGRHRRHSAARAPRLAPAGARLAAVAVARVVQREGERAVLGRSGGGQGREPTC